MKVDGIHIENFLSFDSFEWANPDPHLNLIVGPNAVGKTNLFHAFRAIRAAVSYERRTEAVMWSRMTHLRGQSERIEIGLDIRLTGTWEREVVSTYLAACLCSERAMQEELRDAARNLDREGYYLFSSLLLQHLYTSEPLWAYSGRIVVHFDGNTWRSWYASYNDDQAEFHIGLDSKYGSSVIVGATDDPEKPVNSLFAAWRRTLTDEERAILDGYLSGARPDASCPLPDLNRLPSFLPARYGVRVELEQPNIGPCPTFEAFRRVAARQPKQSQRVDFRLLFQDILERDLTVTENVRGRPMKAFDPIDLNRPVQGVSTSEQLGLLLFQLKNSADAGERARYALIQDIFRDVTGRAFDVHIGGSSQVDGIPTRTDQAAEVTLDITTTEPDPATGRSRPDIPLDYSGAGVSEALHLAALIAASGDRVVLLDEPASNLHPPMQTTILQIMHRHPDTQFFVTTHSPALLLLGDIAKVSRLTARGGITTRHAIDRAEVREDDLRRLRDQLKKSGNARALLFHRAVILVEGNTELASLPLWFEKIYGYSLDSRDIQVYPVDGDQGFQTIVLLLRQFGVPWAIVCDAKVVNYRQRNIRDQLAKAGIKGLPDMDGLDFERRKSLLAPFGVFSAAFGESDEFEDAPTIEEGLRRAKKGAGRSKSRRAGLVAEQTECPPEIAAILEQVRRYQREKWSVDS